MEKRAYHISRLIGVFVVMILFGKVLDVTPLRKWEWTHFKWQYIYYSVLGMIVISWAWARRSKGGKLGLSFSNWRKDLTLGLLMMFPLIAIPLTALFLFQQFAVHAQVNGRVANTLIHLLFFVSFVEELLFRGYFQGRFNRIFGRPYTLGKTKFGLGLFACVILFAIAHLLRTFNPLAGKYSLDWYAFFGSAFFGLIVGFIREKTGGIVATILLHFGWGVPVLICAPAPFLLLSIAVSWAITFPALFAYMFEKGKAKKPDSLF